MRRRLCPAAELRQLGYLPTLLEPPWQASYLRRTAKAIVGLSKCPSELQMARGPRRTGAALDSAPAVLSCESLLSLFQNGPRHRSPGPRRRRRPPRELEPRFFSPAPHRSGRCMQGVARAKPPKLGGADALSRPSPRCRRGCGHARDERAPARPGQPLNSPTHRSSPHAAEARRHGRRNKIRRRPPRVGKSSLHGLHAECGR